MKSKKLFAILTLVAFLMTLIPVAAFAADPVTYSAAASRVSATNTSPGVYDASDEKGTTAKITVTFKDGEGAVWTDPVLFYVKSSRDAEVGWVESDNNGVSDLGETALDSTEMGTDEGQPISITPDENGKVYVHIGSGITGSFTAKIFNFNNASDGLQIGDNVVVKVSEGDGAIEDLVLLGADDEEIDYAKVQSGDDFDIKAVLMDGNNPIEGKTVTFKMAFKGGSPSTLGTAVTDSDGVAKLYYKVIKTGEYAFSAKAGDAETENDTVIDVKAGDPKVLVEKTTSGTKIANDYDKDIEFQIKDENGNDVSSKDIDGNAITVNFDVTAAPADSDYVDFDSVDVDTDNDGVATFEFHPDKVGKYTIKAKIADTRYSKSIDVEAIEFDAATSLSLELRDPSDDKVVTGIRYDGGVDAGETGDGVVHVKLTNAAGVSVDPTSGLEFATSDPGEVTVDANGNLFVVNDDFFGTVNVTVGYTDDNVVGTIAVPVVGKAAAIKVTPTVTGKTANIAMQLVDKNGNATYTVDDEAYKLILPSGVTSSDIGNFNVAGAADFDLAADDFGKYTVTAITNESKVAKTFTVDFAAPVVVPPVIGAKTVTMFIGATGYVQDGVAKVTDVAPFIKDGRTFVAVRAIADAFGATATWNEATQTVTLTRSDRTITIVIGSPTITVVKDGVTSTVTADVPAFIVNGRTVLPFRAVAEAFGATVAYDAATGAVTFNQ